jgi:hypothetical protein
LVCRSESTEAATLRTAALRLVASNSPAVEATWALVWATGLCALGVVRVSERAAPATLRTSGFLLVCSNRLAMESMFWWVWPLGEPLPDVLTATSQWNVCSIIAEAW